MAIAKIYTANLAQYVSGNLVGAWLSLPAETEEIADHIQKVLGTDEELAIHDHESVYKLNIDEYDNIYWLNEQMQELERFPEEDRKLICLIADHEGLSLSEVMDSFRDGNYIVYPVDTEEKLGYYLEENGLLGFEIPEALENYIDYESIGRDWLINCNSIDLADEGYYITY